MKANIAYKFELMPTREQKRIFAQAAGCRRFVWNKAIELQKRCLEQAVPFLKYTELAGRLMLWKKEVLRRLNHFRGIPHPMRSVGWGWIAGRALARLQQYSIEYGSGAHFSMIRHHQIPMDVTVADAVCAASK